MRPLLRWPDPLEKTALDDGFREIVDMMYFAQT